MITPERIRELTDVRLTQLCQRHGSNQMPAEIASGQAAPTFDSDAAGDINALAARFSSDHDGFKSDPQGWWSREKLHLKGSVWGRIPDQEAIAVFNDVLSTYRL